MNSLESIEPDLATMFPDAEVVKSADSRLVNGRVRCRRRRLVEAFTDLVHDLFRCVVGARPAAHGRKKAEVFLAADPFANG